MFGLGSWRKGEGENKKRMSVLQRFFITCAKDNWPYRECLNSKCYDDVGWQPICMDFYGDLTRIRTDTHQTFIVFHAENCILLKEKKKCIYLLLFIIFACKASANVETNNRPTNLHSSSSPPAFKSTSQWYHLLVVPATSHSFRELYHAPFMEHSWRHAHIAPANN